MQPRREGSELYVERADDAAVLRLRVPEGGVDALLLRYLRDGEARVAEAFATERRPLPVTVDDTA